MNNQELIHRVKTLIEDVNATHRYSVSRIYGLYNEVFSKNETPQSCASCLIRKVKELQTWLDSQPEEQEVVVKDENKLTEDTKPKETRKRRRKNGSTEA